MGFWYIRDRDASCVPAPLLLIRLQPAQGREDGRPRSPEERPNGLPVDPTLLLGVRHCLPHSAVGRFYALPSAVQHLLVPEVRLERPSDHLVHRRRHCPPRPGRRMGEVLLPRPVHAMGAPQGPHGSRSLRSRSRLVHRVLHLDGVLHVFPTGCPSNEHLADRLHR